MLIRRNTVETQINIQFQNLEPINQIRNRWSQTCFKSKISWRAQSTRLDLQRSWCIIMMESNQLTSLTPHLIQRFSLLHSRLRTFSSLWRRTETWKNQWSKDLCLTFQKCKLIWNNCPRKSGIDRLLPKLLFPDPQFRQVFAQSLPSLMNRL